MDRITVAAVGLSSQRSSSAWGARDSSSSRDKPERDRGDRAVKGDGSGSGGGGSGGSDGGGSAGSSSGGRELGGSGSGASSARDAGGREGAAQAAAEPRSHGIVYSSSSSSLSPAGKRMSRALSAGADDFFSMRCDKTLFFFFSALRSASVRLAPPPWPACVSRPPPAAVALAVAASRLLVGKCRCG